MQMEINEIYNEAAYLTESELNDLIIKLTDHYNLTYSGDQIYIDFWKWFEPLIKRGEFILQYDLSLMWEIYAKNTPWIFDRSKIKRYAPKHIIKVRRWVKRVGQQTGYFYSWPDFPILIGFGEFEFRDKERKKCSIRSAGG